MYFVLGKGNILINIEGSFYIFRISVVHIVIDEIENPILNFHIISFITENYMISQN